MGQCPLFSQGHTRVRLVQVFGLFRVLLAAALRRSFEVAAATAAAFSCCFRGKCPQ